MRKREWVAIVAAVMACEAQARAKGLSCPAAAGDCIQQKDIDGNNQDDCLLDVVKDELGNEWQTWCCNELEFCIRFVGAGGTPTRFIGRCQYWGGQNEPSFQYSDAGPDGKAFVQLEYHNRDDVTRGDASSKSRNDYDNETTFDQRDCFYKYCPLNDRLIVCTTQSDQTIPWHYRQTGYFANCDDTTVDRPPDAGPDGRTVTIDHCRLFQGDAGQFDTFKGDAGIALEYCADLQPGQRRPSGNMIGDSAMVAQDPFQVALQNHFASTFEYSISAGQYEPMYITAGDILTLYGMGGVFGTSVSGPMAQPANGQWVAVGHTSASATFRATTSAVLDIAQEVSGLMVLSSTALTASVPWRSEGLSIGFQGVVEGPAPPPDGGAGGGGAGSNGVGGNGGSGAIGGSGGAVVPALGNGWGAPAFLLVLVVAGATILGRSRRLS